MMTQLHSDLAAPLILEKILEIVQLVPLERIKDQIVEHIGGRACAPDQGGHRAESRRGADRERACAPDQGGHRAESRRGA